MMGDVVSIAKTRPVREILKASRPLLKQALGEERSERFQHRARARIEALEPGAPRFHAPMNKMLFGLGVPVLGLYQALREDLGVEREPALRLLEEMVQSAFHRMYDSPLRGAMTGAFYRMGWFRELMRKWMRSAQEPHGFHFEVAGRERGEDSLIFEVRGCALLKYFTAHGAPEVVPILCRLDELTARSMRGVKLERTGTIAMGAGHCDFRYVSTRNERTNAGRRVLR
jgi:hypothetical protein